MSYERLERAYDESKTSKPPVRLLEEILTSSIQEHREVYILLDAYDELPETEEGRDDVEAWLSDISQKAKNLKLFITSRQTPSIETSMASLGVTPLSVSMSLTNYDIGRYVELELERHPNLAQLELKLKTRIKDTFERNADGM